MKPIPVYDQPLVYSSLLVRFVRSTDIVMHITHHQEMCKRAEQNQPDIHNRADRYLQKQDRREPKDGKQTAKQHDPDVTFIHLNLLLSIIRFVYPPCLAPSCGLTR